MQGATGVLSLGDVGLSGVRSKDNGKNSSGFVGSAHGKMNCVAGRLHIFDGEVGFGCERCVGDCSLEGGGVVAYELGCAIDHDLGRVGRVKAKLSCVFLLAVGHGFEGERVVPSSLVPVGDVLAENDGLRAGDKLLRIKPGDQLIGWGTARAALGGEELYKDRLGFCRIHGSRDAF
jgi:hypothetical protein